MLAPLLALALALQPPGAPRPLRQSQDAATGAAPAAHLVGSWPTEVPAVSVSEDRSVDDAVTAIAEDAHWNLVLDTGSDGEGDVPGALHQVPAPQALSAVLEGTPLVAQRVGGVVVVHSADADGARDPLAPGGFSGAAKVDARADESVDAAVARIASAAGWGVVANTREHGEALLRLRLAAVPADVALRALLTGTPLAAKQTGAVVTVATAEDLARPSALSGFEPASGQKVSLSGHQALEEALEKIAQAAGWELQFQAEDEDDPTLVLDLREVPVEQALAAVLAGTGLDAAKAGPQVTVRPADCAHGHCRPPAAAAAAPAGLAPEVLQGFEAPLGKTFSGDFRHTPVEEALRQVADAGKLSVVMPQALHRSVTAHFQDAPVEDVLRAICTQNGLVARKQGAVITVQRPPRAGLGLGLNLDQFQAQAEREARRAVEKAQREAQRAQEEIERQAERDQERGPDAPSHEGDQAVTGDVVLHPGEKARDLVAMRGNAKLGPGSHAREVTAVFGSVEVGPGAVVDRQVTAIGGDVHVAPGARVGGEATAIGGRVTVEPGAVVRERTSLKVPGLSSLGKAAETAVQPSFSPLLSLGSMLAQFALYFALGLILQVFWPRRLERVTSALAATPARATAIGMLGVLAVPLLTLLLVVTVVGIPLVLLEGLGLLVAEVLGFSALALLVGRRLPIDVGRGASVAQLALGTGALVVATHLPVVGWLVEVCGCVLALGAVLSTRFGHSDATLPAEG